MTVPLDCVGATAMVPLQPIRGWVTQMVDVSAVEGGGGDGL